LGEFLYRAWIFTNFNLLREQQKKPIIQIENLPYSEVRRNDTIFRIHGLCHGDFYEPLDTKIKKFISNEVRTYENPPEEDYLLESGFAENFDLDKSREMDCLNKVKNRVGIEKIWEEIIKASAAFKSKEKCFKTDSELIKGIIRSYEKVFVDPNYIPKFRKIYSLLFKLPEPFNLELKLRTGGEFDVYFSEEMARIMLHYALSKNLKVLHGVVGLYHESEICYYLPRLII